MRTVFASLVLTAAALSFAAAPADAKGCLKGAAAGAVAGHMAGGHGKMGAAAGCAVGHHHASKKDAGSQPDSGDQK